MPEPAYRLRLDASCEGNAVASRTYDILLDPRAPEIPAPALTSVAGETLASLATAIYPKSRTVREAYMQAIRAANPAVSSLRPEEPIPPGTAIVLPDLRRFSLSHAMAPAPARIAPPAVPSKATPVEPKHRPPERKPAAAKVERPAPAPAKVEKPAPVPAKAGKPAPEPAQAPKPSPAPTKATSDATTKPGRFVLRLSSAEVDLSRSRGIDDRTRAQLRERLLILDADDQVSALLAMRHSLKQLEGRVAELQLKLSTLPPQIPARPAPEPAKPAAPPVKVAEPVKAVEPPKAAEPPRVPEPVNAAEPAKAAEPARTTEEAKSAEPPKPVEAPKAPQAANKPASVPAPVPGPADDGVPPWLWGVMALALGGIAAIAWRLLRRPRQAKKEAAPAATVPKPHSDLDDAEALFRSGEYRAAPASPAEHRVVAASDESLSTSVPGADPGALRRRYIEERFPEIASGTIAPADADSVVKAARLFYEDGALARAVELLQFAVEEDPAPLKPWLALFEIFRLEGLSGEFGELARRFREHHGASDYWRKVQFIGREIDPPNALYREAPVDHLETIGPAATRRAMPVTFDPLAENWLNAPMDFTTDALAASLRSGLLADAGIPETDLVADPMPALKNVEMFTVA
jgi:outer membrane biosynthesis protein TonB